MKALKSILSLLLVLCLFMSAAPAQADAFLSKQSIARDVDADPETTAYTVVFSVPNGVTAPAAMTCREGDSITLPAVDALGGYGFVGWVTENCSPPAIKPDPILTGD